MEVDSRTRIDHSTLSIHNSTFPIASNITTRNAIQCCLQILPYHALGFKIYIMKKSLSKSSFIILTFFLTISSFELSAQKSKFESPEVASLIHKMTDAHGGLDRWKQAASIQFNTNLVAVTGMFPEYNEEVCIDPLSRAAYLKFPGSTGRIAFDGKEAWSAGERKGLAAAPPRFTAWRNFYLLNIPFVIHDEGVFLSELSEARLPGASKAFKTVKMTFGDDTGDTPKDYYLLYIDPATNTLAALEYNMTFASMLPNGMESLPTSLLTFEDYTKVNNFQVPVHYKVYFKEGNQFIIEGKVSNWNFTEAFDQSMMVMPADARVDQSKPRKSD